MPASVASTVKKRKKRESTGRLVESKATAKTPERSYPAKTAKQTAKKTAKQTAKKTAKQTAGKATEDADRVGAVRTAMRQLFEDIYVAHALPTPRGYTARSQARSQARELYGDFVRDAAHRVRTARVGPDADLGALMEIVRDGGGASGHPVDPRGAGLCTRHCRFVGAANALACARNPESIVSICSPDVAPNGDCRFTLCFDAAELGGQIRAFRASGRARMPNPALADPTINPELLRLELGEDEVAALEWQVRLAAERGALRAADVSAADHYVLVSVVLPAMASYLMRNRPIGALVHLYRRFTPGVVKRMLARAGTAVLTLLDNPWLSSLAFVITKVLRTVSCFAAFGVRAGDREAIRRAILAFADPELHSPVTTAIVTIVVESVACVANVFSGNLGECVGRLFTTTAVYLPKWVVLFGVNIATGLMRGIGGPLRALASGIHGWVGFLKMTADNAGIGDVFRAMGKLLRGPEAAKELWESAAHSKRVSDLVADLGSDGFRRFYDMATLSSTVGVLLWLSRRISADTALSLLKLIPMVGGDVHRVVASAYEAVRNDKESTGAPVMLHRVIMFILESGVMYKNIQFVGEIIVNVAVLVQCFGVVFINRFVVGIRGFEGIGDDRGAHCCTTGLITQLKDHDRLVKIDEDHREFKEKHPVWAFFFREEPSKLRDKLLGMVWPGGTPGDGPR